MAEISHHLRYLYKHRQQITPLVCYVTIYLQVVGPSATGDPLPVEVESNFDLITWFKPVLSSSSHYINDMTYCSIL